MLKSVIEKLLVRQNLTPEESALAIREVLDGSNSPQNAAFLALMRAKGETAEELHGIIEVMRTKMLEVTTPCPVLDIVGTGGDGANTLNISTASALLAAACGVKIAKHGNRSVSSLSGSADVLEALGIFIHASAPVIARSIGEIGIGFLFAPDFQPSLKQVKETRKSLSVRTLFNIIGPLLNPAKPAHLMMGVFSEELLGPAASLLMRMQGQRRSMVFHGSGLDELSTVGPAKVIEVTKDGMRPFLLNPMEFGLKKCTMEDLKGRDAAYNAGRILETLEGIDSPFADTIVLNAAVACHLYGVTGSIQEGIALARSRLKDGSALALLNRWRNHV